MSKLKQTRYKRHFDLLHKHRGQDGEMNINTFFDAMEELEREWAKKAVTRGKIKEWKGYLSGLNDGRDIAIEVITRNHGKKS